MGSLPAMIAMIAVVVVHDCPHLAKPAIFRTARM